MADRIFDFFTNFEGNNAGGEYEISDTHGKTGIIDGQNYLYNGAGGTRALTKFYDDQNGDLSILNSGERISTLHVSFDFDLIGHDAGSEVDNGLADGMSFVFGGDANGSFYERGSTQGLSVSFIPRINKMRVLWNGENIGVVRLTGYDPEKFPASDVEIDVTADGQVSVRWGRESAKIETRIPNNEWQTGQQEDWQLWLGGRTGTNAGKGWVDNVAITANITDTSSTIPCFTSNTLIETAEGNKPIEDLRPGDMVATMDDGYQPIRWIGSTTRDAFDLAHHPKLKPVLIPAGALGGGLPRRDLTVSRQHRVLVRSKIAQRMFSAEEILIPAIKLVGLNGIEVVEDCADVTYSHILFDKHQVIFSEGAPTESLFIGPIALQSVSPEARKEIETLFPEITEPDFVAESARPIPVKGSRIKQLIERHKKHGMPPLNS